ncbi:MAG: hypothetical protein JWO51_1910 [Rhodospirillales bacterium]|nr:hypothetical protein [Rhodospirillales bacterium]
MPPSGDVFSMILFGILLACVFGLVGYVWVKLGGRPKVVEYRGLTIRINAGLPAGKIVLTDAAWQPLGETAPDQFDTIALPAECTAAWLSPKDFAAFLAARKIEPAAVMPERRLQA